MTYAQIIALSLALGHLDGSQQIVKDGAQTHVVHVPYDLSAGVVQAIAEDEVALQAVITKEQSIMRAMAQSLGPDAQKAGTPANAKFMEAADKIAAQDFDVKLIKITFADLNLAKNTIPPSVVAGLAPIVSDLESK